MKAEKKVSFEEAMNQLEAIVTRLEAGGCPLGRGIGAIQGRDGSQQILPRHFEQC